MADRDLRDASVAEISLDWRFGNCDNAALKLCSVVLYASGYKAARDLQYYRTIQSIELILGPDRRSDVAYLDLCRKKRNIVEYDQAGMITEAEVDEIVSFVRDFRSDVRAWLATNHPDLLS